MSRSNRSSEPDIQLGCSRTGGVRQRGGKRQWVPRSRTDSNLVANSLLDANAKLQGEIDALREVRRDEDALRKEVASLLREGEEADKNLKKATAECDRRRLELDNADRFNTTIFSLNSDFSKKNCEELRRALRWYYWFWQFAYAVMGTAFSLALSICVSVYIFGAYVTIENPCADWAQGSIERHCLNLLGQCYDRKVEYYYPLIWWVQHWRLVGFLHIYVFLAFFIFMRRRILGEFCMWHRLDRELGEDENDLRPDNAALADIKHAAKYVRVQHSWFDMEKKRVRSSIHWLDIELLSQITTPNVFRFELDDKTVYDKIVYAAQNVQTISSNRYAVLQDMPIIQDTCIYAFDLWRAQKFLRLRHHPFLLRQ